MRVFARIAKYVLGAVIALITALFVGAAPIALSDVDPGDGPPVIRIYVLSNGFHSDIAIPRDGGISLAALGIRETDFPIALNEVEYWAIGWGSMTAYTSLLDIRDLTVSIAAKALAFDEAVMHITPLGNLEPGERVFALDITPRQYTLLLDSMRSWFSATEPMDVTQGFGDRFYRARGAFSPWHTCNSWTGRRLREIGIGIGVWTPISQSLEFGLRHIRGTSHS